MTDERPWSAAIRVDDIPETGKPVALEASAEARAALAKPVGVDAIDALTANFDLRRQGREGVRVSGHVTATVRQTCVVSLEPLMNEIDEEVDVLFAPPREADSQAHDVTIASGDDEAEPLTGNAIDLGVLATEFLILGVDPYPRKADAAIAIAAASDADASHPFAALAAFKKGTVKE